MLLPGQKIFEYKILRLLGQGGFAAVYEARDIYLKRHVAIKQLLPDKLKNETIKRFIQEARIVADLEHPNVVSLYALRIDDEKIYMIMEYLPGGTLRELLNEEGKISVERAVNLTIGICEGLAKLHEKGIIHRDIKGENILLTADGRPKVIDFGIAHVPEESGGLVMTQVGFQPSTLLYSSPEQVVGEKLDPRSDVYQVGELLYMMLSGEHYINMQMIENAAVTHGGTNQFRSQAKLYQLLEYAICEEMPQGLKKLWRETGALAGVVEKALAKNKEDRFKDATEFAETLKTLDIQPESITLEKTEPMVLKNSRLHNKRGLEHISTRNYEQAISEFNQAIELDPIYAEAYNNRSTAHLLMGNYGQAVNDCSKAISLASEFVAAYVNRGISHTGLRQYKKAIGDYDKAIELAPDNVYALHNRGNTHIWMEKFQEALTDYGRVISLTPNFAAAYVNRGIAHNEMKLYDLALADFSQAIDLNPDYVYAYYNRANTYREMKMFEESIKDYSRVIELNPEHRFAYENRGDIYARLGNEQKAAEDYTKIFTQSFSVDPKRLTVARSMLMPAIPLDFLVRQQKK